MAAKFSSDKEGIFEINITPFVDIVLVLLIIFMISTPAMMYRGMKVALPKVTNGDDASHVTLNLYITKDGGMLLDNKPIDLEGVKKAFQKVQENKMETDALLSADKDAPHGKVMEVADELKSLGISQVGFGATPTNKSDAQKSKKAR